VKAVFAEVGEVDQLGAGAFDQPFVERFAEVFVVKEQLDVGQQTIYICGLSARVDRTNAGAK
jgi:hypothetical protein